MIAIFSALFENKLLINLTNYTIHPLPYPGKMYKKYPKILKE